MALGTSNSDSVEELVRMGKSTLELLEKREEVAKLSAARLELQKILSEAEAGESSHLREWLLDHPELANVSGIAASGGENATLLRRVDGPSTSTATAVLTDSSVVAPTESTDDWSDLVAASRNRKLTQAQLLTETTSSTKRDLSPVPVESGSATVRKAEGTSPSKPKIDSLASNLVKAEAPAKVVLSKDAKSAGELSKAALGSVSMAPQVQKATKQVQFDVAKAMEDDSEVQGKRAVRWLSGSVGVSLFVHLILTIGLGLAVITISQPAAPIRILSSSFEDTATLEAPIEVEQIQQLEVTEVSSQVTMPSITSTVDAQATTDIATTVSAMGPISAPTSNPMGSTLSQATGAMAGKGDMMGAVQFLGVGAAGNTFAFLVDNSGSIAADGVFDMAKIELMKSIRALKPTQRFFVAFFGEEVQAMILDGTEASDYPVYATPENIKKLERWVLTVKIQKGRHPGDALELAIDKDPDAIFLLFDGATMIDLPSRVEEFNRVTDLISGERPKVPINTLRFPPSKSDAKDEAKFDAMMKKLAAENGGSYRYVPKPNRPLK